MKLPASIYGRAALKKRQQARIEGKLNKPLRRVSHSTLMHQIGESIARHREKQAALL